MIIETKLKYPKAIHVAFGFNYDVSMIITDLPRTAQAALHKYNRCRWNGYQIEHIPHKWFKVRHDGVTVKIFDIRSFFQTLGDYTSVLESWQVGTIAERDRIRSGKSARATFLYSEIDEIEEYWKLELRLMPELMEKLRSIFRDAGYVPVSWHGPGSLARMALRRHKVYDAMDECPNEIREAARYAFAGGRFELFKCGQVNGKVYNADIHSAYPHFARDLPNLANGSWQRTSTYIPGSYALYHIQYHANHPSPYAVYPLFRRMKNHEVAWPYRVTGWYWNPEAELVVNDPQAEIIEGWVFNEDDPSDRPFSWLTDYYKRREQLRAEGNAAEITLKLIYNAVYGQLAQRSGWNRKTMVPPKSHQLEWAGYITSACRAAIYKMALSAGEKLVSIDTDGVSSLAPFSNLNFGSGLGEWEVEEYEDGIFWQSGIYCLKKDGEWKKARTRGIPRGSYNATDLIRVLEGWQDYCFECQQFCPKFHQHKNTFIGYGLADNGRWDARNTWTSIPHDYRMGGSGKRQHFSTDNSCAMHCNGLHSCGLLTFLFGPDGDPHSYPHYLPWLDNGNSFAEMKLRIDDIVFHEILEDM